MEQVNANVCVDRALARRIVVGKYIILYGRDYIGIGIPAYAKGSDASRFEARKRAAK